MEEPKREIDFERWYRELLKKYIVCRDFLESQGDGILKLDHRLKALKQKLRCLKLAMEWAKPGDKDLEQRFESMSASSNEVFREIHGLPL